MLFNSFTFLLFFPIVTILYFVVPHKFRWLLLASCFFYMFFKPVYILILFFTIIIDYFAGIQIEKTKKYKKTFLILSLIANIGVLCVFKYYNFIFENINYLLSLTNNEYNFPLLKILLPIGLSFHTFQAMSYTIEVYRGNHKAERHFGIYSLYVMFYPQLVAGPIERPQNILFQFYEKHEFKIELLIRGLKRIMWGMFKKLVIADRIGLYVDAVFGNYTHHNGTTLLVAAILFAFQIYCDFSGYCDIALGAAESMGFKLIENFQFPFKSKSVTEFWRRWHISLSTWFNDYLFTPIIINKRDWGKWGIVFGLIITFGISGLWHGSSWNFVVFGLLHGTVIAIEFISKKWRKKIFSKFPENISYHISVLLVFVFCILAWLFFRITNINDCLIIITKIFSSFGMPFFDQSLLYAAIGLTILFTIEWGVSEGNIIDYSFFKHPNIFFRYCFYCSIILSILSIGMFDGGQFIYFQF